MQAEFVNREDATFRVSKFLGSELASAFKVVLRHPASTTRHGITAEGLLSALFEAHGERVGVMFEDRDALSKLVDDYLPQGSVVGETGTNSSTIAVWEPRLLDLLWLSARIAKALNHPAVGIEHFLSALALDPIVSERLISKGLRLKGYLPPVSPLGQ
jgi:hypothetical protein